jgi:4-oxalomesaconate tautomerase
MPRAIPFMQIRGGSSKGLYFDASALPADPVVRDRVLIAALCGVGGDDDRQIDGLGGGHPLTSKVAVVSRSSREDADLEYEFVQVVVGGDATDRTQNCGNILAGVVPFAVESGMIPANDPETHVDVFMVNSGSICRVVARTPGGRMRYSGEARVDGVPGTAAPILCTYRDIAGSACGALLPTGHLVDEIDGVKVTCIDNGMPIVLIRARDLGRSGYEDPDDLDRDDTLKAGIERIRLRAGPMMNLGDVGEKVVPKMTLIAPPVAGGVIHTRSFIPHRCHDAIGVLAAISVATACVLPGTVADDLAQRPSEGDAYSVEHPSGEVSATLRLDRTGPRPEVVEAGVVRTARCLSRGEVLIPAGVWPEP